MELTIKTLTALAALLMVAPGVSALSDVANASSPLLPETDAGINGAIVDATPRDGGDPVTSAIDVASGALAEADRLSTCRLAVPVHAIGYTGHVTDRRQSEGEWLLQHAWRWTTTEKVPVITKVQKEVDATVGVVADAAEPILGASGAVPLLGDAAAVQGATQPIFEDVVVYTTVTRNHHMVGDALVRGTWKEVYITWDRNEAFWFVDALGYVPADGLVAGKEQLVCGEAIEPRVPLRDGDWTCFCLTAPEDGWRHRWHHADVRFADASVYRVHDHYSTVSDVGDALVADVQAAIAALPVSERLLQQQAEDREAAWDPTDGTAPEAGDVTLASTGSSLLGTSAAAGLGAAMAALLALLAAAVQRRRKDP